MDAPGKRLVGPRSAAARVWHQLGRVAAWAFEHYVAVAGLVAVVATGFYGLSYARFYGELNLTPEQAGMAPTQILTRSAIGGLVMTGLIALAFFCTVLVPVAPVRVDWGAADPGSWRRFAGNLLLTALGCAFLFGLGAALGISSEVAAGSAVIAGLILLVVSFRIRRKRWYLVLRPRPLRFSLERYLTAFVAVALPFALLFTGLATFNAARNAGETIAAGSTLEDLTVVGLPFFSIEANPALVYWQEPRSAPDDMPRCAIYLGGSGGDALFYDRRSSSTFHVPTTDVAIQVRDDLASCEGPINVSPPTLSRRDDGALVCRRGTWESYKEPRFNYFWVFNGPRFRDPRYRGGRVLKPAVIERRDLRVAHCAVVARSVLGRDLAVSRTLVIRPR